MAYHFSPAYPTREHAAAADHILQFFSDRPGVDTVLLVNSCARGKASPDSCLDISILVDPQLAGEAMSGLEQAWELEFHAAPVFASLLKVGAFSQVDLEITRGLLDPGEHGWTSGPDEFELEVGNLLAYSVPLGEEGAHYRRLKQNWLPYYGQELRLSRLQMVRQFCLNNLAHIPLYTARGLYFQSFARLYHAFGEFLQGLFIARSTYPIAYDKWVHEQIVDILDLPQLYAELPRFFEIGAFESQEMDSKASRLAELVEEYLVP